MPKSSKRFTVISHKNAYSFACDDVRVCPVDIGVGVVAERVLVDPRQHRGSVEEVVSCTDQFPHPRLVGDSKMTEKMGKKVRTVSSSVPNNLWLSPCYHNTATIIQTSPRAPNTIASAH